MKKRLITEDYRNIVYETFKIPESDYYKYYLNKVEENYRYNNDIIEQLKSIINGWLDWYRKKVYGSGLAQSCGIDDKGNKVSLDLEKTSVPLLAEFGIKMHVNKAYFEKHLAVLKIIQGNIELKQKIVEFENQLPKSIRKRLAENPMPDGFDYKDIGSRIDLLKNIPELFKKYKNEIGSLKKIMTNKKKEYEKENMSYNINPYYDDVYKGSHSQKMNRSNTIPFKMNFKDEVVFIYNLEFAGLFILEKIPVNNEISFNPSDFYNIYREGFNEGLGSLKKDFSIKRSDILSKNKIEGISFTLRDILENQDFKFRHPTQQIKGLLNIVQNTPFIWNKKTISDFGYYNGLLHSIDEIDNKFGEQIKAALGKTKDLPLKQSNTIKGKESSKKIDNIDNIDDVIDKIYQFGIFDFDFENMTFNKSQYSSLFDMNKQIGCIPAYNINGITQNNVIKWFYSYSFPLVTDNLKKTNPEFTQGYHHLLLGPYDTRVFGAPFRRNGLVLSLKSFQKFFKCPAGKKKLEELSAFLKLYAKGFRYGITNDLLKKEIDTKIGMYDDSDNSIKLKRIWEYALYVWYGFSGDCPADYSNPESLNNSWYYWGLLESKQYQAWHSILSNDYLYSQLASNPPPPENKKGYEQYIANLGKVESNQSKQSPQQRNAKTNSPTKKDNVDNTENIIPPKIEFCKFFKKTSLFKHVMELLVEEGICHPHTYIWIEEKISNKGTAVSLVKILHHKGYYKDNKMPKQPEIKKILLDIFGVDLSLSTVKQNKVSGIDRKDFRFIPLASTIEEKEEK